MELVPATDVDWPAAWAIQREAFLPSVTADFGGWTDEQVAKCQAAWVAEQTRLVRVDGELVGWVRVERRPAEDWLDLVVLARRGEGLGTRVMRLLQDEARQRGVPLRLSVHTDNPARRLYARLGFTASPRDPGRVFMVWNS